MSAASPRPTPDQPQQGFRDLTMLRVTADARERLTDEVSTEVPIALVYNGVSFAVMMATPCDLEDFALGFALAEGVVAGPEEFELVDILRTDRGITLQGLIPGERFDALQRRRRSLAGRSGCGLCGIESLEEAVRPAPPVGRGPDLDRAVVAAGMRALAQGQSLNPVTGGAHAAAFIDPNARPIVREDVGRHNALDKLIGALAADCPNRETLFARTSSGFAAITSRASWEMVHKAAHVDIAVVAAISAPTTLAIEAADAAGITLIAFARDESMNVYTHAERIG